MGRGYTFYECECGGEIFEEWDNYGSMMKCDKCDNPRPLRNKQEEEKEEKRREEAKKF